MRCRAASSGAATADAPELAAGGLAPAGEPHPAFERARPVELRGGWPLLRGWLKFAVTCSVGLLANVGVAAVLVREGVPVYPAALAGIVLGSVWNYALSSRFVWGRFR